jgi:hypothetical protein
MLSAFLEVHIRCTAPPRLILERSAGGQSSAEDQYPWSEGFDVTTAFVTYENHRNPHVTVHSAGCGQIGKNGGRHKHGQGAYREHATYESAIEYAENIELKVIVCSYCKPTPTGLLTAISGRMPEEVMGGEFREGALSRVTVNAYERNREAPRRCIETYGPQCIICNFSFGEAYGPEADGYIHVHHVRPLSELGDEYVVDPVEDLRPVCPNCHAVLHLSGRCRSIEEVRRLLSRQTGSVPGHLTPGSAA